jgi:serine/threonine-protein kinase
MPSPPPSPPRSAAQAVLNDRYEVRELIAEGGMAHVYRGRDRVLDRDVAIKVLRPQYAASPEFLSRFRREARLAASVAHPNLVNVFDVGDDGDRHYIVMELLPGQTLKDLVAQGPLALARAVDLAQQVAKGMAYAHRRGLVHRDLKPQNVLLTEDGHAKVADFGLAQGHETAQLTTPGTVWGTVQYISPEQAQGLRPDARSDVYALGAVFYELLTGSPPYDGGSPASIMMRHVYDPPPSVRDVDPTLPLAAERLLSRALAKAPDDRFQTMDELAQALTELRGAAEAETMVWAALPGGPTRSRAAPKSSSTPRVTVPGPPAATRTPASRPNGRTSAMPPARPPGVARPPSAYRPAPAPTPAAPRRPRRRWLPLALAGSVLAFFALMALGALLASQLVAPLAPSVRATATLEPTATPAPTATLPPPTETPIPQVPVPNLIGQPLARAQERLAQVGLKAETAEDFSREVPAGAVAAQDPPANTPLDQGKTIKLVISKGPQRATVPVVIGDQVDLATKKLADAGFTVKRLDEFTPQGAQVPLVAAGIVFDESPRGGEANVGTEVTIRVSKGRDEVAVPRVIGQPESAALDRLAKDGFKVEVTYEPSATVDPGVVFTQDPVPDVKADRGALVRLRVRRDPTPAPTATAAPAAQATATRPATPVPTSPPAPTAPPAAAATAAGTRPAGTATAGRS